MIHQPLAGVQGQATDVHIQCEHLLGTKKKLNTLLAEASGQSLSKVYQDTERDNYMNATEALEYGLVDMIGEPIMKELSYEN